MNETTCPHCGAVIGYYNTERKARFIPGHSGRFSSRAPVFCGYYISCPSCGHDITIIDNQTKD